MKLEEHQYYLVVHNMRRSLHENKVGKTFPRQPSLQQRKHITVTKINLEIPFELAHNLLNCPVKRRDRQKVPTTKCMLTFKRKKYNNNNNNNNKNVYSSEYTNIQKVLLMPHHPT
jgi:hypothetical protein